MESLTYLILLFVAMFIVVKSADFAITYSTRIAYALKLPAYVVGFVIVAIISILPETFISITSALDGVPAFGLGVLFGSNVADLTLVMFLIIIMAGKSLSVESKIIKDRFLYVCVMLMPIILGLDGRYSRFEGLALIVVGVFFYLFIFKDHTHRNANSVERLSLKDVFLLILSMAVLLIGSNLTVRYGVNLAGNLGVAPVLVGMFVVALGTTLPELSFSIRSVKRNHDDLALGDMLGTVIADATIVVGTVALISPFSFEKRIVYVTGVFMVLSIFMLLSFMKTGKKLTKNEAYLLILFYLLFVISELTAGMIK